MANHAGYETLLVQVADGIGTITLNRPEVRNALNATVVRELRQAMADLEADDEVTVVVFTGAGEKSFAAGADISQLPKKTFNDALASEMQRLYGEVEALSKPTIAAVNGYALGGGCELAISCDIRLASENAKFGLPELNLGIIPGAGGTQRLARLIGQGRAMEVILTGRMIDAAEAERIGLVSRSVPAGELSEAVRQTAAAIVSKGPVAVRLAKTAVKAGMETDLQTGLLIERLAQAVLFTTQDKVEGTTAFLEKRKPKFTGK